MAGYLHETTFVFHAQPGGRLESEPGQAEGQSSLLWGGWDSPCPLRALLLPLPTDTKLPFPHSPTLKTLPAWSSP